MADTLIGTMSRVHRIEYPSYSVVFYLIIDRNHLFGNQKRLNSVQPFGNNVLRCAIVTGAPQRHTVQSNVNKTIPEKLRVLRTVIE